MLFPATLFLLFDPMNKVHFGRLRAQALALFVPSTLLGLLFEALSGKLQQLPNISCAVCGPRGGNAL